jgi:hypothetical protein
MVQRVEAVYGAVLGSSATRSVTPISKNFEPTDE